MGTEISHHKGSLLCFYSSQGRSWGQHLTVNDLGAPAEKGPLCFDPWGLKGFLLFSVIIPAPIQTTSSLYERGFVKVVKGQNKEQVPPPAAEPKKPANKKQPKKVAAVNSQNQKQGPFRSLEDALRAVSASRRRVQRRCGR